MAARKMPKIKKKKIPLPRKVKTGIGAAPTTNFAHFAEYFRVDLDNKEISYILKKYIKDNIKDKDLVKKYLAVPDYHFTSLNSLQCAMIVWIEKGFDIPQAYNFDTSTRLFYEGLDRAVEKKQSEASTIKMPARTPADVLKLKKEELIGSIEEVLDTEEYDIAYSPYDQLQKDGHAQTTARAIIDYYGPVLEEAKELVHKKTPDLVEGYSHMPVPVRKKYLEFLQHIIDDTTRFVMAKKATRKTSKPRTKTAYAQVSKLQYLKESKEFKITSIDPLLIVGARVVWAFNTKYKQLTEFVSRARDGFEVKGTSLQMTDPALTRIIRLRKPQEFLPIIQSKTQKQISVAYNQLTTKQSPRSDGRINKDTLIMRVFDKCIYIDNEGI
jgi:hypothetical protein